jgi:hypothetical protein
VSAVTKFLARPCTDCASLQSTANDSSVACVPAQRHGQGCRAHNRQKEDERAIYGTPPPPPTPPSRTFPPLWASLNPLRASLLMNWAALSSTMVPSPPSAQPPEQRQHTPVRRGGVRGCGGVSSCPGSVTRLVPWPACPCFPRGCPGVLQQPAVHSPHLDTHALLRGAQRAAGATRTQEPHLPGSRGLGGCHWLWNQLQRSLVPVAGEHSMQPAPCSVLGSSCTSWAVLP